MTIGSKRREMWIIGLTACLMTACGGGSSPASPTSPSSTAPAATTPPPAPETGGGTGGGTPSSGTLTAVIDGMPFTAASAGGFVRNGILSISGAMGSVLTTSTTLSLAASATAGATQNVAAGSGVNATLLVLSGSTGAGWQAVQTAGGGSVTVQTLTATNASGVFSFTMPAANGTATGTKLVTNGVFNIALTP